MAKAKAKAKAKRKPESREAIQARQKRHKLKQSGKGMERVSPAFYVPAEHKEVYLAALNAAGKLEIERLNKKLIK